MSTMRQIAELRVQARADRLQTMRARVRKLVEGCGCAAEAVDCIVLAVNEACMNIIQHAYGGDTSEEIIVQVLEDGEELVFRLIDFAAPVDERDVCSRALDELRPGGIGVHLIREVMDSVSFLDCPKGVGNILELRKRIKGQTGG